MNPLGFLAPIVRYRSHYMVSCHVEMCTSIVIPTNVYVIPCAICPLYVVPVLDNKVCLSWKYLLSWVDSTDVIHTKPDTYSLREGVEFPSTMKHIRGLLHVCNKEINLAAKGPVKLSRKYAHTSQVANHENIQKYTDRLNNQQNVV